LEEILGRLDIHADYEYSFRYGCQNGHLNIVQFLLTLEETHGHIDVHFWNDYAFHTACKNGHLTVAKFLLTLEKTRGCIDIHMYGEYPFRYACAYGHMHVVKFLLLLEPDHGSIDIHAMDDYAFKFSKIHIRHRLVQQDPEYNWKQVEGYKNYFDEVNRIVEQLVQLHQKMIQLSTDILELNVIQIVKDFLL
jgi:ankyrin repeat protein